jgi:hypothetical protein
VPNIGILNTLREGQEFNVFENVVFVRLYAHKMNCQETGGNCAVKGSSFIFFTKYCYKKPSRGKLSGRKLALKINVRNAYKT